MIYYRDENLTIRDMEEGDIPVFMAEYAAQGWHPDRAVYEMRLKDAAEGKCDALTAVWQGHPAGSVLEKYQRKGIGGRLMDAAEKIAAQESDTVWLGVGLCGSYGTAQRMYIRRGYIPDGSGIWYRGEPCRQYETVCTVDDDLILYLSRKLPGN